jgi:predicted house-cleaning noncanonical NTP pyrophosphatase (MazG superfamily)
MTMTKELETRIAAIIEEHNDCDEACRAYDFGEVARHIAQKLLEELPELIHDHTHNGDDDDD